MDPRRIVVVANQTACGPELLAEVKARMADGPCTFTLVVPATPPQEHATWTEGSARAVAQRRMEEAVECFRAEGADVKGVVGDASPVSAVDDVLNEEPHDEVILSTLPTGISRWLKMDVAHRIARLGLPVKIVIGKKQELHEPAT